MLWLEPAAGERVAQRHRHVAQPALVTDAPDRGAFGVAREVRLVPAPDAQQLGRLQQLPRLEIGHAGALCVLVPWAHQLAVVATVDAVADQGPQLGRYSPGVLNGEVGDAAARIEP